MLTNNFNQSAGQLLLFVAPLEHFYLMLDIRVLEPAPKRASAHTRCPCQLGFSHRFHILSLSIAWQSNCHIDRSTGATRDPERPSAFGRSGLRLGRFVCTTVSSRDHHTITILQCFLQAVLVDVRLRVHAPFAVVFGREDSCLR